MSIITIDSYPNSTSGVCYVATGNTVSFTIISGITDGIIVTYEWHLIRNYIDILVGIGSGYTLSDPQLNDEIYVKVINCTGTSGTSGSSGTSGTSGTNGSSGTSGISGINHLSELLDVNVSGISLQDGQILVYDNGYWVNSGFTSNYCIIDDVYFYFYLFTNQEYYIDLKASYDYIILSANLYSTQNISNIKILINDVPITWTGYTTLINFTSGITETLAYASNYVTTGDIVSLSGITETSNIIQGKLKIQKGNCIVTTTTTTFTPIDDKYVVLISMDGARFSETWGSGSTYIPNIMNIAASGTTNINMYTSTPSETIFGHCAMTTGLFENIPNDGSVNPTYPTFLSEYLYNKGVTSSGNTNVAKMIFSKDKLYCLHQSTSLLNNYLPYVNAGVNGDGTGGYRADSLTHELFKSECLGINPPIISMVSYREPDSYAHTQDYEAYVNAITQTDTYINEIWNIIQSHTQMSGRTTLMITNDHGRHDDPNFWDHGGGTESEIHVLFVAIGPNILINEVVSTERYLTDIPSTILELYNMEKIYNSGNTMYEIFNGSITTTTTTFVPTTTTTTTFVPTTTTTTTFTTTIAPLSFELFGQTYIL